VLLQRVGLRSSLLSKYFHISLNRTRKKLHFDRLSATGYFLQGFDRYGGHVPDYCFEPK